MLRSVDFAIPPLPALWRRCCWRRPPPQSPLMFCRILPRCFHLLGFALILRCFLAKHDLVPILSSYFTQDYCAPLHPRRCRTAKQTQENHLKNNNFTEETTSFVMCLKIKGTTRYRGKWHCKDRRCWCITIIPASRLEMWCTVNKMWEIELRTYLTCDVTTVFGHIEAHK